MHNNTTTIKLLQDAGLTGKALTDLAAVETVVSMHAIKQQSTKKARRVTNMAGEVLCNSCAIPIQAERLRVLPTTDLCIDCASEEERRQKIGRKL